MAFFRKKQQGLDWRTFAQMAVQGHELTLCDEQGITDGRDEHVEAVSKAVLNEIGGIDGLANLMARLSREAGPNEQLDDKLFEISGYNAARARLFDPG